MRDRIVKLFEDSECIYVAVEIGRGTVNTRAKKDLRILPKHAYSLPALSGSSIALRASYKSAGTFWLFCENLLNKQLGLGNQGDNLLPCPCTQLSPNRKQPPMGDLRNRSAKSNLFKH